MNSCAADGRPIPEAPDDDSWVDDDFFGWVHHTTSWHTTDGRPLRKLRGGLAFVEDPGVVALSPPAVHEDDLEQ